MPRALVRSITTPVGVVFPYAGLTAPDGFFICDGSAISRTTYSQLFTAIGVSYGVGDGSTTFNIPDYRGHFLRGALRSTLNSILGSGTASSNNATFTNHGLNRNGFKVRLLSGTLSGLTAGVDYFAIVVDANTLAFASSQANALAGTKITIVGANSAVIRQYVDPDSSARVGGSGFFVGDPVNALGSYQPDDTKGHTHAAGTLSTGTVTLDVSNTSASGYVAVDTYDSGLTGLVGGGTVKTLYKSVNASAVSGGSGSSGGTESRPANTYVNYIIKF